MKYLFYLTLFLIAGMLEAQVAPDKYFVKFTDKAGSPYSIDQPEEFLSQRAIDRRENYNIDITEQDIPVNPQYLQGVASTGAQLLNPTKWLNGVTVYTTEQSVLDEINLLPYVESVYKASSGKEPTDEKIFFAREYYENTVFRGYKPKSIAYLDYGDGWDQIATINGIPLHDLGYQGQGMLIAVLDAGFYNVDGHTVFDSLWDNNRIIATKDFVDHSGTVFDYSGHGTSVLSIMGGYAAGELIGTAPMASYILLRSEESIGGAPENIIEEYNWVSAAEYADSAGADIINSSLGYTEFDDPSQNHVYEDLDGNTTVITRGADIAASKGILVTNSAGNSGNDLWYYIGAPADGDSVFAIGAISSDSSIASFSSHGPTADGRIKPNVSAMGAPAYVANPFGGYYWGSGTSFSSPVIAGMNACLWQAFPHFNNKEIMDAIQESASRADNPDNDFGYGIPNYQKAMDILTVNENYESISFEIFPNPVINYLNVRFTSEQNEEVLISVFDQLGRLLRSEKINSSDAGEHVFIFDNLNELEQGVYLLRIKIGDKMTAKKFIR